MYSWYYDKRLVREAVLSGRHRESVGGMWEEIGRLQLNYMISVGLRPEHKLLDVGCGALRGGIRFVEYLNAGNYYGVDMNESLLDAGYENELRPSGLVSKLPRSNLRVSSDFDFSGFGERFDYAIALSVFTHLPMNTIRVCLEKLRNEMSGGGMFFATVFEAPPDRSISEPVVHQPGGIETYADRDPYHYRKTDIAWLADTTGWKFKWIGDFAHPRNQKIFRLQP